MENAIHAHHAPNLRAQPPWEEPAKENVVAWCPQTQGTKANEIMWVPSREDLGAKTKQYPSAW
jgi:hypothetical protein